MSRRSLQLEIETLRTLLDDELDHVAGGYSFASRESFDERFSWWMDGRVAPLERGG